MSKRKIKPNYRRQDIMGYEQENCQSHLSDETLEQMKKDFEHSKKLNTPKTISHMMKQHCDLDNEHLCHWYDTALGRAWVERE